MLSFFPQKDWEHFEFFFDSVNLIKFANILGKNSPKFPYHNMEIKIILNNLKKKKKPSSYKLQEEEKIKRKLKNNLPKNN
jgi:hypothetical protein